MLIRTSYTKVDIVGHFDESRNRTANHLEYGNWTEFFVVWKKDTLGNNWIELYEDYVCVHSQI